MTPDAIEILALAVLRINGMNNFLVAAAAAALGNGPVVRLDRDRLVESVYGETPRVT